LVDRAVGTVWREAGGHTLAGCEMITDIRLKGNNSDCNKLARGTQKLEKMANRPSLINRERFNDPERAERPETALFSRK
jgi:hypothetical protein